MVLFQAFVNVHDSVIDIGKDLSSYVAKLGRARNLKSENKTGLKQHH